MEIVIDIRKFSATFKINDELVFRGDTSTKRWRYRWQLFDAKDQIVTTIRFKPSFISFGLNTVYLMNINNEDIILDIKGYKPHAKIVINNDLYLAVVHKGNKMSFFKNDRQFASLEQRAINLGLITKTIATTDDDADITILAALIYAITCTYDAIRNSSAQVNFGYIGPEFRKIANEWIPNLK
ncbi:hypothetical protein MKQ70_14905 [Chitinophaga sedimenti]|uniref:hypothetical protein n=1 Tax=Chitinophaga sedimenti TaxID=2033606 RepID=UPI0020061064|nr:hypothetical protein [Chitinophaga sedimenti]MCK7556233.1 hypothetical protein [Chitinophaga sedimenti]